MKITKSKLKQIIKEELQQALEENALEELAAIPAGGGKARDCDQLIRADGWKWGNQSAPTGTSQTGGSQEGDGSAAVERLKEKFKYANPDCARHMSFDELWEKAFHEASVAGISHYAGQGGGGSSYETN